MKRKIPKKFNLICKNCNKLRDKHEDWIATGEYAENAICPFTEMDELGRYKKLIWFEPMDNLEYLEYKSKEKDI